MDKPYFFYACALALCIIFVGYLSHFFTGIPKSDDFPMMLQFLDNWEKSLTFSEKYTLLTEQFLEHRMIAMKLTVLTVKFVNGALNINAINSIGITIWLATLFVLYKAFSQTRLPLLSFVPVLLLTLHPGYGFDGLLWAATWMAFPWAIFLSLASFYLLAFKRSRRSASIAWLLLFLALFSHGNGIFSVFIGAGILLAQKRWQELAAYGLASLLALIIFFTGYTQAGTMQSSPVENILNRPGHIIGSIGAFTGASVYFPDLERTPIVSSQLPAIIFGLILSLGLVGFSAYLFQKLWKNTPSGHKRSTENDFLVFCCSVGMFVIITGTAMSCIRTLNDTIGAFSARYHFYSALLISVVYMMSIVLMPALAKKTIYKFGLVSLGVLYCLGQYWFQTAEIAHHVNVFQAGLYNFRNSGHWIIYKEARIWERGVNDYSNRNLRGNGSANFKLPGDFLAPGNPATRIIERSGLSSANLVELHDSEDSLLLHVKGPFFQRQLWGHPANATYVYLVSPTSKTRYPLFQERRGLRQFLTNHHYYKDEARVALRKKWFPPGDYRLYFYVVKDSTRFIINPQKSIRIKKYPYEV
jgi:hypothetical protein